MTETGFTVFAVLLELLQFITVAIVAFMVCGWSMAVRVGGLAAGRFRFVSAPCSAQGQLFSLPRHWTVM